MIANSAESHCSSEVYMDEEVLKVCTLEEP
jgi:hypothetical protein